MTTTETRNGAGVGRVTGRFRERYEAAAARNDSLLCVGLDPDPKRHSATVPFISKNSSSILATWKFKFWPISTATWSIFGNVTARCSVAIKS